MNNGKIKIDCNESIEVLDFTQVESDIYLDELNCFLECVKFNKRPPIGLDDGIEIVKIVEAIKRSSNTRQWVDL